MLFSNINENKSNLNNLNNKVKFNIGNNKKINSMLSKDIKSKNNVTNKTYDKINRSDSSSSGNTFKNNISSIKNNIINIPKTDNKYTKKLDIKPNFDISINKNLETKTKTNYAPNNIQKNIFNLSKKEAQFSNLSISDYDIKNNNLINKFDLNDANNIYDNLNNSDLNYSENYIKNEKNKLYTLKNNKSSNNNTFKKERYDITKATNFYNESPEILHNKKDDLNFPKLDSASIKELFECYDIDDSGTISALKLQLILKKFNIEFIDEEVDEMIELVDMEGDGQINFKSFHEFIMTCIN